MPFVYHFIQQAYMFERKFGKLEMHGTVSLVFSQRVGLPIEVTVSISGICSFSIQIVDIPSFQTLHIWLTAELIGDFRCFIICPETQQHTSWLTQILQLEFHKLTSRSAKKSLSSNALQSSKSSG